MTESDSERNPVEALAEEFLDRYRRGERPALSEYTRRHPDLAGEIRDLFPALVMLEDARPGEGSEIGPDPAPASPAARLERLGDYRILREVGRGGMGIVYEAEQESLGRHVALKVLPAHALLQTSHLQRFQREARSAARLHHTNIVPVFGVGEDDGLHYYVMQFIPGQGLDQVIAELQRLRPGAVAAGPDRPGDASLAAHGLLTGVFAAPATEEMPAALPSSSAVSRLPAAMDGSTRSESGRPYWHGVARIGIQVADALAYAHAQGTLHRDIKPSNLLLDNLGVVWVTDFGLAKGQGSEDLTHTGDFVGTLRYMAPERFGGQGDGRSDVYSLGLTLYEMITLRAAFDAPDRAKLLQRVMHEEPRRPRALNRAVPRDLETVVLKAIARDPAHRYQNAAELADDLRRFTDDKPVRARRASTAEQLWRWCRRNPALASLAAALLLALTIGVAGITWKWLEADSERRVAEDARGETQRVLAGVMLNKGITLAELGEVGEGTAWMLEALNILPPDSADLDRVIRTNLSAWMAQTHGLRLSVARPELVRTCNWHPDGSRFVTTGPDGVCVWDAATGKPLDLPITVKGLSAATYSPDGTLLLVGAIAWRDQRPHARLWHAADGRPAGEPVPHPENVNAVAFTADGQRFATGDATGVVRLWETATGKKLGADLRHEGVIINSLAFTPDGKTLLVATADSYLPFAPASAYQWDVASGQRIGPALEHKGPIRTIAVSPDGRHALTASADGSAQLWDVATGAAAGSPFKHAHFVLAARFSPDGRTVATAGRDGVVRWWDVAAGYQLTGALPLYRQPVQDLAFSPDGATLLVASGWENGAGTVTAFRIARGPSRPGARGRESVLKSNWLPQEGNRWFDAHFATFSPDRRHVLAGGWPGWAMLSDTATDAPALVGPGGRGGALRQSWSSVRVTAFSPDGRRFATASHPYEAHGEARIYDATTGRPTCPPLAIGNYVSALAFSPDGALLATGDYSRNVILWDAATGKRRGEPLGQPDIVVALAFSPDGKTLTVGHTRDYTGAEGLLLWDVASGRRIGTPLKGPAYALQFSPDGGRLVTADPHALAFRDGATAVPLPGATDAIDVTSLAFSPDGRFVAVGQFGGAVQLYDANTGRPAGAALPYAFRANAVAFSPDAEGRLVLAGYADGSARLWDRVSRKALGPPVLQSQAILAVAFAPDGRTFFTTAADGRTRAWSVPEPAAADPARLALRLRVHTGLQVRAGAQVAQLVPAEWAEAKRQLEALEGSAGSAPAGSLDDRAFHDARARDAEQDGVPFGAGWHLDRLIAVQDRAGPQSWLAFARRAAVHSDAGRFVQAAADYERVRQLAGTDRLLGWQRRRVAECQARSQWETALWYADRLIATVPDDWEPYADRVVILDRLGRWKEAAPDIERAVKRGADDTFLIGLAEDLARASRWQDALPIFARAAAQAPADARRQFALAIAALKVGDRAVYRAACASALEAAGADPPAPLANAAAWLCVLGPNAVDDFARPVALAEKALANSADDQRANVMNTLGAVLCRADRPREAIVRLQDAIRLRKGNAGADDWLFLALAHHRLGETDAARKCLAHIPDPVIGPGPIPWDRLEIALLRAEIAALVEGKVQ